MSDLIAGREIKMNKKSKKKWKSFYLALIYIKNCSAYLKVFENPFV